MKKCVDNPTKEQCSQCPIKNCSGRQANSSFKEEFQCLGDCYHCDAALGDTSILSESINTDFFTCKKYSAHPSKWHKNYDENNSIYLDSKIENLCIQINQCKSHCKYSEICTYISKNANFDIIDLMKSLDINWLNRNNKILDCIPQDKLFAFSLCPNFSEMLLAFEKKQVKEYLEKLK